MENTNELSAMEPKSGFLAKTGLTWRQAALILLAFIYAMYHFYTAGFGPLTPVMHRSIHLFGALVLAFLMKPGKHWIIDAAGVVIAVTAFFYINLNYTRLYLGLGYVSPNKIDIAISVAAVIAVFVAGRRTAGTPICIVVAVFMVYAYVGKWIPGIWGHRGLPIRLIFSYSVLGESGFLNSILATSANTVAPFLLMGAILVATGGTDAFMALALNLTGRFAGGPAKVSVVSSGLMGMLQGSIVSNVATTGAVTIPLMKRNGYEPEFAAATESASSMGGQIMPPVMGATVFLMSELVNIPYGTIALCALPAALLYYFAVFMTVHFHSLKRGLGATPKENIPALRPYAKLLLCMLATIGVMCVLLGLGYTTRNAGFYSICTCIVSIFIVTMTSQDGRGAAEKFKDYIHKVFNGFVDGGKAIVGIAIIIALANIVSMVIAQTGLGITLGQAIFKVGEKSLLLSLIIAAVICIILGMGVPSTSAYLITISVAGAALTNFGIAKWYAHMFCLYFSLLAAITPPVASGVFVASSMSGCKYTKAALPAIQLAIAGYLLPFMFIYNPALLLQGTVPEIVSAVVFGAIGLLCLSAAFEGNCFVEIGWLPRILLFASAIMNVDQRLLTSLIGSAIGLGTFVFCNLSHKKKTAAV